MSVLKKFRQWRNELRFQRSFKRFYFMPSGRIEDFKFADLRHLVIAKMDGKLGDSQVITAFIHNLREQLPKLQITVICTDNIESIYRESLELKAIKIGKKAQPEEVKRAVGSCELFTSLPCDALLTTEPNFRPRDLCLNFLLQPKYLIGIEERSGSVNINLKSRSFGRHISEYFEDLLLLGGLKVIDRAYLPIFTKEQKEWAQGLFDKECIGIAPYGASVHRHLSDACILDLLRFITTETSLKSALLFNPSAELLKSCQDIAGNRLCEKPKETTPQEFAALIAACGAIVSVDSAPVHLANGSRTPALCIYSGHDPEGIKRWGPAPFAEECSIYFKQGTAIEHLNFADFKPVLFDFLTTKFENSLMKKRKLS